MDNLEHYVIMNFVINANILPVIVYWNGGSYGHLSVLVVSVDNKCAWSMVGNIFGVTLLIWRVTLTGILEIQLSQDEG